jgi:glutaminase
VPKLSRSLKGLVTLQGKYNADDDWLYGIGVQWDAESGLST